MTNRLSRPQGSTSGTNSCPYKQQIKHLGCVLCMISQRMFRLLLCVCWTDEFVVNDAGTNDATQTMTSTSVMIELINDEWRRLVVAVYNGRVGGNESEWWPSQAACKVIAYRHVHVVVLFSAQGQVLSRLWWPRPRLQLQRSHVRELQGVLPPKRIQGDGRSCVLLLVLKSDQISLLIPFKQFHDRTRGQMGTWMEKD